MSFDDSDRPSKRRKCGPQASETTDRVHSASQVEDDTPEERARLEKEQWGNQSRFRHRMEDIFQRYSIDVADEADEINIRTGAIEVDRGHLSGLPDAVYYDDDYESFTSDEDGIVDDHDEDILDFLQAPAKYAPAWLSDDKSSMRTEAASAWQPDDVKRPLDLLEAAKLPNDEIILRQFGVAGPAIIEVLKRQAGERASTPSVPFDNPSPRPTLVSPDDEDDLSILASLDYTNSETPVRMLKLGQALDTTDWSDARDPSQVAANLLVRQSSVRKKLHTLGEPAVQHPKSGSVSREDLSKSLLRSTSANTRLKCVGTRDAERLQQMPSPSRLRSDYVRGKDIQNPSTTCLRSIESPPNYTSYRNQDLSRHAKRTSASSKSRPPRPADKTASQLASEPTPITPSLGRPQHLRCQDYPSGDPQRPYRCISESCTKTFSTESGFLHHHEGGSGKCDTRPCAFKCPSIGCPKAYRSKASLRTHRCKFASLDIEIQDGDELECDPADDPKPPHSSKHAHPYKLQRQSISPLARKPRNSSSKKPQIKVVAEHTPHLEAQNQRKTRRSTGSLLSNPSYRIKTLDEYVRDDLDGSLETPVSRGSRRKLVLRLVDSSMLHKAQAVMVSALGSSDDQETDEGRTISAWRKRRDSLRSDTSQGACQIELQKHLDSDCSSTAPSNDSTMWLCQKNLDDRSNLRSVQDVDSTYQCGSTTPRLVSGRSSKQGMPHTASHDHCVHGVSLEVPDSEPDMTAFSSPRPSSSESAMLEYPTKEQPLRRKFIRAKSMTPALHRSKVGPVVHLKSGST